MDSNHDKQYQKLLCYRYTIALCDAAKHPKSRLDAASCLARRLACRLTERVPRTTHDAGSGMADPPLTGQPAEAAATVPVGHAHVSTCMPTSRS